MLQADRGSIVVHFEEGFPRDAVDFVELAGYQGYFGNASPATPGRCSAAASASSLARTAPRRNGRATATSVWAGSDGRGDGRAAGHRCCFAQPATDVACLEPGR